MDLFPTILKLAGIEPATYGELDGFDMRDFLKGKTDKIREVVYYYDNDQLYAIRKGAWKAHFTTHPSYSKDLPLKQNPALLYNLDNDPSEKYEIGVKNAEILANLTKEFQQQEAKKFNVPRQMDTLTTGPLTDFFRKNFPKLKLLPK
jgi:arylsulfatase A